MVFLVPYFLCLLLVMSLYRMVLKHRAKVLSRAPKPKKAVMCLRENNALDELCSGMSYSAVGC